MKVALVVPGGVDRSGTERVIPAVLALIGRVARTHELHVFATSQEPHAGTWPLRGATVHSAGRPWPAARTARAIVAEHRRGAFDVVHALWVVPAGLAAAAAAAAIGRPLLVHVAGGELACLPEIHYGGGRTARGRLLVRKVLERATAVTAASAPMLEAIGRLGVRAERLPLGVALDEWKPTPPPPRDPGRPARLVHVGHLNRVKDQPMLLRAAARLAAQGIDFTLDVAGGDTTAGATAALATRLGLDARVRFHGDVPHARLHGLVAAADVMMLSSRHEAGPVAVLEAAAVGVPTVGTGVGHVAEWAPHAAVAVPVADADALAREVARLLADEPRRVAIARAAHHHALAEDADHTVARVLALYAAHARRSASMAAAAS